MRVATAACLLLAGLSFQQKDARLVPLEGEPFRAEVLSVDKEGVLRYRAGAEEKSEKLAGFRSLEFSPATASPARRARFLSLRSGQELAAELVGGDGADAKFRLFTGEEVLIPMRFLRGWRGAEKAQEKDLGFVEAIAGELPRQDVLFVQQEDGLRRVPTKVVAIRGENLVVEYGGEQRPLPLSRIYGVVFAESSGAEPVRTPLTPKVRVRLKDGADVEGLLVELDRERVIQRLDEGFRVTIPLGQVARVVVLSDRLLFLGDATPASIEQTPAFNRKWPVVTNRALEGGPIRLGGKSYELGVCMVPRAKVTWSLKGKFHVFVATIGIGDESGDAGHARFRVVGDGKELFVAESVRGGAPPKEIRAEIEGVDRLSLEVDFGEGLDVGDHCVFADARVIALEKK